MRETSRQKAERLLLSGRVVVVHAQGRQIRALVRGDTEGFHVVEHVDGAWICDCTAAPYGRGCSHRLAVQTVTAPVASATLHELIGATS